MLVIHPITMKMGYFSIIYWKIFGRNENCLYLCTTKI